MLENNRDYYEHLKDFQHCNVTGKRCYSYAEARAYINDSKHFKAFRGKKMPKREYKCEFCGSYHVTSQKHQKNRKRP